MKGAPRQNADESAASIRRGFDVVAALAGLVLLLPLMLVIALAIRIDTPGPVFYSQVRVGRGGQHFRLHKFRKFGHGPVQGGSLTLRQDSRMTRVGRLIERTKLDELPQLWNVLIGDMSVVGPRPETVDFADCFRGPYRAVLDHKPGLFGPNQAIFRQESQLYPGDLDLTEFYRTVLFPAKAAIDLSYFPQRTFWADLCWIVSGGLAIFGVLSSVAWFRAGAIVSNPLMRPTTRIANASDSGHRVDAI